MTLTDKVLRKKAKKFESQAFQKNQTSFTHLPDLDLILNDVYHVHYPKPVDYINRRDLVRILNTMAKEIYGNSDDSPVVEEYGSFLMDMFSPQSDLDLSVNFGNNGVCAPHEKKIQTLRKFAKKLHSLRSAGHVTRVESILTARVPIVKFVDLGTGIECDLSVDNRDGIEKSEIIHQISAIDERFKKLSVLMKHWAKAHDINSSKDRTLNSLSIISLVAFHLQTRNPPILPPFSVLLKDGADPVDVGRVVQKYINYGKKNEESLAELFVTLLIKLASVEKLWHQGLCVSLFDGLWISKTWDSGIGSISIEDFVYRSVNFARAVSRAGAKKIYSCIHHSIGHIGSFLEGQIQESQCKELIFGSDVSTMATVQDMVCQNLHKDTVKHPIDPEHHQRKKMRLTGIFEETRLAQSSEGEHNEPGWNGSLFAKERGTLHLEQCRTLLDDNRRESGYLNFRSDKWQNHAGNSGLMPPAHARQFPSQTRVASSFDNARFYDPQKLPPVPFPYPTGFGESHEPLPQFSPILQNHPGFFRPMSSHGPFYGKQTLNHQEFIP